MISTRGRYALRVLADLAEQPENQWTPLKEIAARQAISHKYLETIMTTLSKANLVAAVHGKGGGYKLVRKPEAYTVLEILEQTEATLAPVNCLDCHLEKCQRASECLTLPLWQQFNTLTRTYFNQVTLKDLVDKKIKLDH